MKKQSPKVRKVFVVADRRPGLLFGVEIEFLGVLARKVGVYGVAVYNSLCGRILEGKPANYTDIALELGISRKSVMKGMAALKKHGAVRISKGLVEVLPVPKRG